MSIVEQIIKQDIQQIVLEENSVAIIIEAEDIEHIMISHNPSEQIIAYEITKNKRLMFTKIQQKNKLLEGTPLVIKIPKQFKQVFVEENKGSISINGGTYDKLYIETNKGAITIKDGFYTNFLIEDNKGSITVSEVIIIKSTVESNAGNLSVSKIDIKQLIDIEDNKGYIQLDEVVSKKVIVEDNKGSLVGKKIVVDELHIEANDGNASISDSRIVKLIAEQGPQLQIIETIIDMVQTD